MSKQLTAKLRVCASCEWIWRWGQTETDCPYCHFASYGAHYVYGKKAYKYEKTQEPWKNNQLQQYLEKLNLLVSSIKESEKI
jgi:hypothetical protein